MRKAGKQEKKVSVPDFLASSLVKKLLLRVFPSSLFNKETWPQKNSLVAIYPPLSPGSLTTESWLAESFRR
jgi:hypothetical protein